MELPEMVVLIRRDFLTQMMDIESLLVDTPLKAA